MKKGDRFYKSVLNAEPSIFWEEIVDIIASEEDRYLVKTVTDYGKEQFCLVLFENDAWRIRVSGNDLDSMLSHFNHWGR